GRRPLAEGEAGRREIESLGARGPRHGSLRRESSGAGSAQPGEFLFRERHAPAFWTGSSGASGPGDSMAERSQGKSVKGCGESVDHRAGGVWDCEKRPFWG